MTFRHAQYVLRRRLGPLAVLARGAGRWSVILMADEHYGAGTTITGQHQEIGQAVSEAIKFAIANPGYRHVGLDRECKQETGCSAHEGARA
jgi:hypothetical protein